MQFRKRLTAWILTGLVLFVTLVSCFEIACETQHVCIGADCRICAHITAVRELLRIVSVAVVLVFAVASIRSMQTDLPKPTRCVTSRTPVCLHVRLLN